MGKIGYIFSGLFSLKGIFAGSNCFRDGNVFVVLEIIRNSIYYRVVYDYRKYYFR